MTAERTTLGDSRVARSEALARTLESEIVTASLSPGERLGTKDDLRQRFGVAVATINEAVRLMEMRGLVVARPGPGGGVFVTSPSARASVSQLILGFNWGAATLADCVEVRNVLEPLICRHAAGRHEDADIQALSAILDKMQSRLDDPHAYFEGNWAFHRRLATMCANAPLQSIYLLLCDFLASGLSDYEFDVIEPERIAVHRRLLAAIDAGEGPALERALAEHAENSPLTSPRAP
ncbi:MAG: FadR/GntR family transcriptional regulator [Solirubrobacteraceae bacterium]